MSFLSDIENMDGFPEVPSDAFSEFNLDNIQPIPLVRTYKAYCSICLGRAYTTTQNTFFCYCYTCTFNLIPFLQRIVRGYLVRQKLKRLKNKELIYRWFTQKGINGGDLTNKIGSFFLK